MKGWFCIREQGDVIRCPVREVPSRGLEVLPVRFGHSGFPRRGQPQSEER